MFSLTTLVTLGGAAFLGLAFLVSVMFRRVVRPNEVHVVQRVKETVAYGVGKHTTAVAPQATPSAEALASSAEIAASSGSETEEDSFAPAEAMDNGNVYYEWPTAIPKYSASLRSDE